MQTFLPYPNFLDSAKCLDYKRLGKQRVEAKQLIDAINKKAGHWYNHPACKMWENSVAALMLYFNIMSKQWVDRGYKHTMGFYDLHSIYGKDNILIFMPEWLGDEKFHASHRSNLLRKDAEYYGKFGWTESNNLPYYWPISSNPNNNNLIQ